MQKKLLIISALMVFVSTLLYAFMLIRNAKAPVPAEETLTSDSTLLGGASIPVTPLISPTMSPQLEAKINSLKNSWQSLGGGFYLVKNVPALEAPSMIPDYSIEYDGNARVFSILLYKESLLENRQKAGQDIMSLLGIGPEETCKLDIQVYIPPSVNVDYAGRNLKLPFCAGFTDLKGVTADNGVSNINPDDSENNPSDVSL